MADKGQHLLSFQFQLHRLLDRAGHVSVYQKKRPRPPHSPTARRPLHADISRTDLRGEHADRRLLVLSFHRDFRSGDYPLRSSKDLWPPDLRTGLVRLRLLDRDGP